MGLCSWFCGLFNAIFYLWIAKGSGSWQTLTIQLICIMCCVMRGMICVYWCSGYYGRHWFYVYKLLFVVVSFYILNANLVLVFLYICTNNVCHYNCVHVTWYMSCDPVWLGHSCIDCLLLMLVLLRRAKSANTRENNLILFNIISYGVLCESSNRLGGSVVLVAWRSERSNLASVHLLIARLLSASLYYLMCFL